MTLDKHITKVALLGNPNSGKSSLFNKLTGLRQHVSNFPGVTVDKKVGFIQIAQDQSIEITDFPGTYSIYPTSEEEKIVVNILTNPKHKLFPEVVIYVADSTQLERHLLFATQIKDLGLPMIFVLNMVDLMNDQAHMPLEALEYYLGCPVITNALHEEDILEKLIQAIKRVLASSLVESKPIYKLQPLETQLAKKIMTALDIHHPYLALLLGHHYRWLPHLTNEDRLRIEKCVHELAFKDIEWQIIETMSRYDHFQKIIKPARIQNLDNITGWTDKIDSWITHRILGPILFFVIMFFVFQAIYSWASYPMDFIESAFASASTYLHQILPKALWSNLLIDGLLAGLGGVLVFIPQIAILFFLIALLEESGYMSRVVFMFDGLMQRFGMNGRSMVALISSGACAIPAIMSTRTISNPKERLITILVSPLISCSARLPVYAVLIGFVVPETTKFGVFNAQGLAFMGLYLLGIIGALTASLFFKKILQAPNSSFLMMELPQYKSPIWSNVWFSVKEKVWSFIVGAGKVIIVVSMILWFLASFGPQTAMQNAQEQADRTALEMSLTSEEKEDLVASLSLEASYIGHLGHWIEPMVKPLGFDWKIGIALITSFAAREVFVGTMATIYSVGSTSDEKTIREKMAQDKIKGTETKIYNPATSAALLVFYVFAMQCMSTLAITKKETNSWKWPLVQFLFMGVMAYVGAFLTHYWMA